MNSKLTRQSGACFFDFGDADTFGDWCVLLSDSFLEERCFELEGLGLDLLVLGLCAVDAAFEERDDFSFLDVSALFAFSRSFKSRSRFSCSSRSRFSRTRCSRSDEGPIFFTAPSFSGDDGACVDVFDKGKVRFAQLSLPAILLLQSMLRLRSATSLCRCFETRRDMDEVRFERNGTAVFRDAADTASAFVASEGNLGMRPRLRKDFTDMDLDKRCPDDLEDFVFVFVVFIWDTGASFAITFSLSASPTRSCATTASQIDDGVCDAEGDEDADAGVDTVEDDAEDEELKS